MILLKCYHTYVTILNMIFNVTMITFWLTLLMNTCTNMFVDDG